MLYAFAWKLIFLISDTNFANICGDNRKTVISALKQRNNTLNLLFFLYKQQRPCPSIESCLKVYKIFCVENSKMLMEFAYSNSRKVELMILASMQACRKMIVTCGNIENKKAAQHFAAICTLKICIPRWAVCSNHFLKSKTNLLNII